MLENSLQNHSESCAKNGKYYLVDIRQLNIFAFVLVFGVFSSSLKAGGKLTPYAGVTVVKDDNLYRLDSGVNASALSISSKDDTIYQTKAGVAVDWMLSRQRILADVSVTDNQFEKNSNLNYDGQAMDLKWSWLFGSYLTGQLGWSQKQTLNDFSNTVTQKASKKNQQTLNFLAKWRYAPDWEMGVKLSDYDLSYELQALQVSDRKSAKKAFFWNYITHAGNRVGMTWQREVGEYPGRELDGSNIDPKYQQDSLLLNVIWQVTVKSKLSADIGWNGRTHPSLTERDYDGFNTKVAYAWFPTAKTMLNLNVFRQLASSNYSDATFSENTGYALNAAWRMSEKLSFNGMFKHETRDYVGQVNGFKESYDSVVADVIYQTYTMLDVSLRLNQSLRDSTRLSRDYQSQSIALGVNVKF